MHMTSSSFLATEMESASSTTGIIREDSRCALARGRVALLRVSDRECDNRSPLSVLLLSLSSRSRDNNIWGLTSNLTTMDGLLGISGLVLGVGVAGMTSVLRRFGLLVGGAEDTGLIVL